LARRDGDDHATADGALRELLLPERLQRGRLDERDPALLALTAAKSPMSSTSPPSRAAQHSECSSGHGPRFLANLWQMALRAEGEDALCLVELRGFEPLTPCMPYTDQRPQ
jgi:hypothetical protein